MHYIIQDASKILLYNYIFILRMKKRLYLKNSFFSFFFKICKYFLLITKHFCIVEKFNPLM